MLDFKSLAAVAVLLSNIDLALGQGAAWSQCESFRSDRNMNSVDVVKVAVLGGLEQQLVFLDIHASNLTIVSLPVDIGHRDANTRARLLTVYPGLCLREHVNSCHDNSHYSPNIHYLRWWLHNKHSSELWRLWLQYGRCQQHRRQVPSEREEVLWCGY